MMMSCACMRSVMGKRLLNCLLFAQLRTICGVSELVAQVSMTSCSPWYVPPQEHVFCGGCVVVGSIGRSFLLASCMFPQCSHFQRGKGTPKWRCLLMHQ